MRIRRLVSFCVILSLLTAVLTGCGNTGGDKDSTQAAAPKQQKENETAKTVAMGRYVEQTVALPELSETEKVVGLIQKQGVLTLYTCVNESETEGTYYVCRMSEDGTWTREESAWLNQVSGGKNLRIRSIRPDSTDAVYAWYFDDDYQAHIVKTADEFTAEEIKIKDLTVEGIIPNGFAVTGKGEIAISHSGGGSSGDVVLYSAADGNELRRFKGYDLPIDNVSNFLDAVGNKLLMTREDGAGFVVYDTDTGEILDDFETDKEQSFLMTDAMIRIGPDQDYYYLSPAGLSHFKTGGSIMETLIDGSLNTMGMEGILYHTFLVGADGQYYVMFKDAQSYELVQYVYDEGVAAVPEIKLTMYGLTKNQSVSRAISTFQKENPDVQIIYYTAQDGGAATISDSIRTLNTELLSGKGADIILLDGLPVDSYIEKGVLADISDVVSPMIEQGELLSNITKSDQGESGAVYGIPVRFSIPVLVGDEEINAAFQSLQGMRQYAQSNTGKEFLSSNYKTLTYEELAHILLYINYKEIVGTTKTPSKEKLAEFLETVMETGNAIGATVQSKPKPPATEADIKSNEEFLEQNPEYRSLFNFGIYPDADGTMMGREVKGITDIMEPMGLKAQYGRTVTSANDQFIPQGTIGINQSSPYADRAKDFLRCVLSEAEQSKDLGGGMPVNKKALEAYGNIELNIMTGSSYMENGVEKKFTFSAPTKEEIKFITDMVGTLTEPLIVDTVLEEMIMSEAGAFFDGSITAEKAAEAITAKANTYFAE